MKNQTNHVQADTTNLNSIPSSIGKEIPVNYILPHKSCYNDFVDFLRFYPPYQVYQRLILIADKLNEAEFNEPEIFTYIMPIFLEIARSEIQYLKIDYDDLNDLVREPFAELYDFYTVESIVDALNNAYGTIRS